MSKQEQEQSSHLKKIIVSSTESLNKKEEASIRTSQSMNTESLEYFNQRITTKNNITESSFQGSNQQIKNQELKCTCNHNLNAQKNLQELKCTCGQGRVQNCTCGKSVSLVGSNQNQIKIKTTTTTTTKYNNAINTQNIRNTQNIITEKKKFLLPSKIKFAIVVKVLKSLLKFKTQK